MEFYMKKYNTVAERIKAANESKYFTSVCETLYDADLYVAVDDTIMIKGVLSSAGSAMLENYKAPFSAETVEKLQKNKVAVVGKTKVNEFGISGCFFENPKDASLLAVKDQLVDAALCNDFSGDARRLAVLNGIYYIHPTYGIVSRYGLIASVSSADAVGLAFADPDAGFKLLQYIAGHDDKDGTSRPAVSYEYKADRDIKNMKTAYIGNVKNIASEKYVEDLKSAGVDVVTVDLKYLDYAAEIYQILSSAEISNNISRFDGVKFGIRAEEFRGINELYLNTRGTLFSAGTKLTAIIGSMVLSDKYYKQNYDKSMRIRRLIRDELIGLLETYDVLITPLKGTGDDFGDTAFTALANLAGLPALSIPVKDGAGVQLIAKPLDENALYSMIKGGAHS